MRTLIKFALTLDVDYGDHQDIETVIEGEAEVFLDLNYGADADGNRGIPVQSIVDINFEPILLTVEDNHTRELRTDFESLKNHKQLLEAIESYVHDQVERRSI